ncbi:hypothetical protein ACFQ6E_16330 [Streptomyces sp. NPDC056462]|uniref:hypothetical protein n=1 Tax=Streptomyces sp. NPDC056462 TaxID=3345826 RepID=UPI0036AC6265
MGKTWQPSEAKAFAKQLELGTPYYVIANLAVDRTPYEDPQMYSEYVFTSRLPFTNNPCTSGGYSAETLCQNFGPVYEDKPRSMRRLGSPGPQVAGPADPNVIHPLDEAELAGLEKRVSDGERRRRTDAKAKTGRGWNLFR